MNRFRKIIFCLNATAGLRSFFQLIRDSRLLSRSKRGITIPEHSTQALKLRWNKKPRQLFYRPFEGDLDIFYEIFFRKMYALEGLRLAQDVIFVDLGANIGISSLYILKKFPSARFIMVEADYNNIEILNKNFPAELKSGQAKIIHAAIMDYDGTVGFRSEKMKFNSHITDDMSFPVRAISMNNLVAQQGLHKIDLLKIDIEGAEHFLFKSNVGWMQIVSNIFIEIHSLQDELNITALLKQHGFEINVVSENEAHEKLILATK